MLASPARGPSPALVASLQHEAESLWEPYDLRIRWVGPTAVGCVDAQGTFGLVGHLFEAPADVGRALGRVLAHEIGHVILGAPGHQPRGLMRFAFPPSELIGHSRLAYRLSPLEQARLRQREAELQTRRGP
jgi:hypothetical protein